jgi:uncharacterized membrane protein
MDRVPLKDFYDNYGLTATHIISNTLIGVFFFAIGICIVAYAKYAKNKSLAFWIAGCFLCCSLSRVLNVFCIWYDWYLAANLFSLCTGLVSIPTTVFIMLEARRIHEIKELKDLEKEINEVKEKQEVLKTIINETKPNDVG